MKKFISLITGLLLAGTSVLAQGPSYKHTPLQFLSLGGNLYLTNNGSLTAFPTNVQFLNALGTSNITAGAPFFTNSIVQPSGTTVSNILYYPYPWHDVNIFTDGNGDVAPLTVSAVINNQVYMPQGNQNAGPGTNFPGIVAALNASNTQVITFTFQKVLWETNADLSTTNQFSFNATCNGTNEVIVSTNLPTAFVQGAAGIRLSAVSSTSVNNTFGNVINRVTVTGWSP